MGVIFGKFLGKIDEGGREFPEFYCDVADCPLRPLEVRFGQLLIPSHVTCHKIRYLQITDPRGQAGQRLEEDLQKKIVEVEPGRRVEVGCSDQWRLFVLRPCKQDRISTGHTDPIQHPA